MCKTLLALLAFLMVGCAFEYDSADYAVPLTDAERIRENVSPVYSGQHSYLVWVLYYGDRRITQPTYTKCVPVKADSDVQAIVRALFDASDPWPHHRGIWCYQKHARLY